MNKHVYKRLGNIRVCLVDGNSVRRNYNSRFRDCGMKRTFSFIPKDEIWVDQRLSSSDRNLVLLRAIREYNLSVDGMKLDQMKHAVEPVVEKCRRFPLLIPHRLNREYAKIKRRERMNGHRR